MLISIFVVTFFSWCYGGGDFNGSRDAHIDLNEAVQQIPSHQYESTNVTTSRMLADGIHQSESSPESFEFTIKNIWDIAVPSLTFLLDAMDLEIFILSIIKNHPHVLPLAVFSGFKVGIKIIQALKVLDFTEIFSQLLSSQDAN